MTTPSNLRKAFIRKIKQGQFVRRPMGNNPARTIADMIKWLELKPGIDVEFMFEQGFMIISFYGHKTHKWTHRLTDVGVVHNVWVEVTEDEL